MLYKFYFIDESLEALLSEEDESVWFCAYCKDDNPIMYGDLLWTKAGNYRWWPAEVCLPSQIPEKVFRIKSGPGEFAVRYLGSNDYNWMNRGRCFPYRGKEDDPYMVANYQTGKKRESTSAKASVFQAALNEAESLFAKKAQNSAEKTRTFKTLKG